MQEVGRADRAGTGSGQAAVLGLPNPCGGALLQRAHLSSGPELIRTDGKLANASARRGEDRIGHGRREGRCTGLSDPARGFDAWNDVGPNMWCHIDPQHAIGVEVCLHNPAFTNLDPIKQRSRQSKINGAFHLRSHRVGIDRMPAIHCTTDAMHAHFTGLAH